MPPSSFKMRRMMALADFRAERREPRDGRRRFQIASADAHPELQAQLGDSAHARAADADEVQPPLTRQKTICVQFTHAAASPRDFKTNFRDVTSRVRMRLLMRAHTHLVQPRRIANQRFKFAREIRRKLIVVANYYRAAALFNHARVVHLLLVFVEGIRHENGRARAKSNVGHRHRAGARDNQIGAMQRVGDVVDKRHHLSREPDFAVCTPHQPLIRLPSLMHYVQIYNTFSTDFESPYDTNIQAMRAATNRLKQGFVIDCPSRGDRSGWYLNRVGLPVTTTLEELK